MDTTVPPSQAAVAGAATEDKTVAILSYVTVLGFIVAILIASLLMLPALDHATVREWLHSPLGAVPMALFVITAFYHGLDGMKVVVDDYVHEPGNNFALNTLLLFLAVGGAAFALFALAKVAFGGAA